MMMLIISLTIILACFLFLSSVVRNSYQNRPPGSYNLPFIGNLHCLGKLPHRSLHKLSQKYGPLMYLKLGSVPTIIASSSDIAKEFLKNHDVDCCSRPFLTSHDKLSYGLSDIAFAPYGEQWRELRKLCIVQLFSAKKVDSFRSAREEEVGRMMSSISSQCHEINLTEEIVLLANNVTCRTAMGKRYYSDGGRLHHMLKEAQGILNGFFFADYVPSFGWLDVFTGMRARLEKNFQDLDSFYSQVIQEHRDKERKDAEDEDVIDALLYMQRNGNLTDEHVKGVLMNIFLAGTETSASIIEWVMTELLRNPRLMSKAQDEIRKHVGNKSKVEECDLINLDYLKSIIKETLRLHMPVPLLLERETIQKFEVNGFNIPPKTRLIINAWAIARDAWKCLGKAE